MNVNDMTPDQLRAELIAARTEILQVQKALALLRKGSAEINQRIHEVSLENRELGMLREILIGFVKANDGEIVVNARDVRKVTKWDELRCEKSTFRTKIGPVPGFRVYVVELPPSEILNPVLPPTSKIEDAVEVMEAEVETKIIQPVTAETFEPAQVATTEARPAVDPAPPLSAFTGTPPKEELGPDA